MLSSTEFAEIIGVTTRTLSRWHADGKLIPAYVLPSGERRYSQAQVDGLRGKLPASVKMAIDDMVAEMDVLYNEWQRGPLVDERKNHAKWRIAHDRLYDFRAARGPEVAAYLEEIDAWLEDGVRHSKEDADEPFLKEAKRNRGRK